MIPFALPVALKTLPWRWIGIGAAALAVAGMIWWSIDSYGDRRFTAGKAEVQEAWDKDILARAEIFAEMQARYRQQEQEWQVKANAARQERSDEDARTIAGLERTLRSLQNRPERPAVPGASPPPDPDQASDYRTGAFLHREDGEFLIREAARADKIRAALRECYSVAD